MDIPTLALARQYADRQRLAYSESTVGQLTFDGNPEGKFIIGDPREGFIKMSDTPIDPNSITKISMYTTGEITGVPPLWPADGVDFGVDIMDMGGPTGYFVWVDAEEGGVTACLVVPDGNENIPTGTYFLIMEGFAYTTLVEWQTETIHPIDPKYLPGAVLPVVKMDATALPTVPETTVVQLDAYAQQGTPIVLKVAAEGLIYLTCVLAYVYVGDDEADFQYLDTSLGVVLNCKNGVWTIDGIG